VSRRSAGPDGGRTPGQSRVRQALDPLAEFLHEEAVAGIVLLAATVVALAWANSPAGDGYAGFWERELAIGTGDWGLRLDLRHWVNDALMAIFFFVVGLEIKRELVVGELRERRAAALPGMAAVGGVVLPGLIFYALAAGGEEGVAEALGVLRAELENAMALLGTPTVAEVTRAHAG
jgi:NhaA family Na+:H+ antiporter